LLINGVHPNLLLRAGLPHGALCVEVGQACLTAALLTGPSTATNPVLFRLSRAQMLAFCLPFGPLFSPPTMAGPLFSPPTTGSPSYLHGKVSIMRGSMGRASETLFFSNPRPHQTRTIMMISAGNSVRWWSSRSRV